MSHFKTIITSTVAVGVEARDSTHALKILSKLTQAEIARAHEEAGTVDFGHSEAVVTNDPDGDYIYDLDDM